ncbi:MAG TPA: hypothetical protein VHO69_08815 [Phototrophicaceae bacterium]|nr:hypothetical protein [Phototrophicaceae bacterium]
MTTDKPKKKTDGANAPDILVWEIPFEFISPFSVDECCERLQDIKPEKSFNTRNMTIWLASIDSQNVSFQLAEAGGRLNDTWAMGDLEMLPDATTRIRGKVGRSPEIIFLFLGLGVMFLVLIPVMLKSVTGLLFVILVIGCISALIYYGFKSSRENLLRYIENSVL